MGALFRRLRAIEKAMGLSPSIDESDAELSPSVPSSPASGSRSAFGSASGSARRKRTDASSASSSATLDPSLSVSSPPEAGAARRKPRDVPRATKADSARPGCGDAKLAAFLSTELKPDLARVPGLGDVGVGLLKNAGITNAFQLVGKFLSFRTEVRVHGGAATCAQSVA